MGTLKRYLKERGLVLNVEKTKVFLKGKRERRDGNEKVGSWRKYRSLSI